MKGYIDQFIFHLIIFVKGSLLFNLVKIFFDRDNKDSSSKREKVAKKPKEKRERDRESVSTTKTVNFPSKIT